ncbi:MAG: SLC13 family permease [Methanomassiliicoccales archaeon]|jgi:Na+/H+ antiporter NhaD/arsenite permease-like protein
MESAAILALLIFVPTYLLISVRNLKFVVLERYAVVLFGAALMVLLGVVSATDALDAIDLGTLALLFGMMLIVIGLELCGFFDWVALQIIKRSQTRFKLLAIEMVVIAVLSALILNDTVVLLFTPIVVKTCIAIKANPVPYLVGEAVAANIGSVATPVGNPQNAFIAVQSGMSFNTFFTGLAPIALVSLIVAVAIIYLVFRKDFTDGYKNGKNGLKNGRAIDSIDALERLRGKKVDKAVYLVLGILALVFLGFILSDSLGLPLALIAFIGGASVLFLLPLKKKDVTAGAMVRKVDWTLLLFFVGLFVLLKGVSSSGLLGDMMNAFQSATGDGMDDVGGLTLFSALLSNLISNVPAAMLLAPFVSDISSTNLWLALASSSTLAGNATILGAAANIIVVEKASAEGVEVSLKDFVKAGLPITVITLLISILFLSI